MKSGATFIIITIMTHLRLHPFKSNLNSIKDHLLPDIGFLTLLPDPGLNLKKHLIFKINKILLAIYYLLRISSIKKLVL
jgi:hypothetical protein